MYEILAEATERAKTEIMVEVLRVEEERRVNKIAMILDGRDQARAGLFASLSDVIARLKVKDMLPADIDVASSDVANS